MHPIQDGCPDPANRPPLFTGAPLPAGADVVAIQERCVRDRDWVAVPSDLSSGANCRHAGEDIERGAEVIGTGTRLRPQHLGLAASVGAAQLRVYRRLRVAVFDNGNELVMPGLPLGPGQFPPVTGG